MPSHLRSPPASEAPKESVVSRLLIAPLTFISFLLSLFLIDTRNTTRNSQQHNPRPHAQTLTGRIHDLIYEPASPYAYIDDPGEQWYWRTRQRERMRAEVEDAFALRRSVLYALLGCVLASLGGAWVLGRWVMGVVMVWL